MRKPAFAYFYGLCILISFSLLTITVRGYQISISYCLFFIYLVLIGRAVSEEGLRRRRADDRDIRFRI